MYDSPAMILDKGGEEMAPAGITPSFSNPRTVIEAGERIYRNKYKEQYEKNYHGKFVAINVRSESATLGNSAEEALELAMKADPNGLFHLIRVGFPGAFQAGRASQNADQNWLFGQRRSS